MLNARTIQFYLKLVDLRCFWVAATIGATGSLAGGLLGNWLSTKNQKNRDEYNVQQQERFARNSIQWRVEDAKKAGIHPLVALGAQGASYQPVLDTSNDGGLGASVSNAAEYISQGMANSKTDPVTKQAQTLELKRMELENQKLEAEINAMGQSPYGLLGNGEAKRGSNLPGIKQARKGADFLQNANEIITLTPEKDIQDLVSESTLEYMKWALNNSHSPAAGQRAQSRLESELRKNGKIRPDQVVVWRFVPDSGNEFAIMTKSRAKKLSWKSDWRHPDHNAGYFSGKDSWGK